MTKRLLLGVALIAVAGSAFAADLPVKAPPPSVPPSWTGFFVGVSLGARVANNDWRSSDVAPSLLSVLPVIQLGPLSGAIDSAAPRVGGYAGYNWQFAPAWVAGFEADFGWANNRSTANPAPGLNTMQGATVVTNLPTANVSENWDGSVRGRLGMLITPDTLLYGTAGLALQSVRLSASCTNTGVAFCTLNRDEAVSRTMTGWTVGGGLEHRFWGNWFSRIEYRFADFGTFDHAFFGPLQTVPPFADDRFTAHVAVRTHTANVGLAYRF